MQILIFAVMDGAARDRDDERRGKHDDVHRISGRVKGRRRRSLFPKKR